MGFLASCLSSIFGGGFGLLSVPAIFWMINHFSPETPHVMQMTIATGTLCAIPLGVIATYKQIRYKNFDLKLYKSIIIVMTIGALIGAYLATIIDSHSLKYIFGIIVLLTAIWLLIFKASKPRKKTISKPLFKSLSSIVGGISTLTGVSVFSVPFFILCGIEIKKAIGTSTAIVFTYTTIAGMWMICLGIPVMGINWHNLGYANLPIFFSAFIPCILGGLVGAKLVHVLPSHFLKRIFIVMMFIVSILMLL